jgi:transcriptional regulator with XRE-family HTH domain
LTSDAENGQPAEAPSGVGARLRAARLTKGWSARQLAARADVTPAYLSRLETGQLSPTVSTLSRVMQALGEPVAVLFQGPDDPGPLVRRGQRRVIRSHGVEDQLLSPTRSGRLEVLETTVSPGQGSGSEPYSHPGEEECVVMLSGRLRLTVSDATYDLKEGDALTFPCRSPHAWTNPGRTDARALWIVTPAGY